MRSPTSNLRIRWLPDSSGLGFYCRNLEGKRYVYRLAVATGEWKTVPLPRPIKSPSTIDWSKNGKSFYYCQGDLKEGSPGIFEYNMETGEDRHVYSPKGGQGWITYGGMTVSPDYKWLAFHEEFDFDDYGIVVLDLETGNSWRAVSGLSRTAWSPDQKLIMATQDRLIELDESAKKEGPFYVLVSPQGGADKKISLADSLPKSRIRSIDWSRDGKEIVFDIAADVRKFYFLRNVIPKGRN
jgi:Tol biopolymer transport system component